MISVRPSRALVLALVVAALGARAAAAQPAAALSDSGLIARAERFVDQLSRGEHAAAAAGFDAAMKAALPAAKLGETWAGLQGQLGAFRGRTGSRVETLSGYQVVFVTSRFARASVDLQMTFDAAGRIAGFFVRPAANPAGPAPAPSYARKDTFRESAAQVGSGTWALPGTLTLPVGTGPFPAVVLVHGSGPLDRDETVGPNKPFRDLAWGLASRGVAVLRYDKRTLVHRDKLAALPRFTVREETVDDALAAADLLRRTPRVDPRRVFVLGHSLGGMLVPRIGARDAGLAGLIVMAGAARPLEQAILDQLAYLAAVDGQVTAGETAQIEQFKAEAARLPGLTESSTAPVLGVPPSYWLDLRGYHPPRAARDLRQPLLVLQGERDYQVTMAEFRAWQEALAGRPDAVFRSYPKLDHLFRAGEGTSTPADYEKPGHVAAEVIEDVAAWIAKTGAAGHR